MSRCAFIVGDHTSVRAQRPLIVRSNLIFRSWHIADYFSRLAECLLSGVKRTLFMQLNMSANDPKQT
jgi:hypothetical protein